MLAPKPHAAGGRLERGEVDFARTRLRDDPLDVARGDSAAGHNDDAVARPLHQFDNERQALEHGRFLARGQHPIDAEPDQRLERPERVGRDVERAVEGDREGPGEFDQAR